MAKTDSLATKLAHDYPGLSFQLHDDFYWSPDVRTVYYISDRSDTDRSTLLHETAHGILAHTHYKRDIDLLKIEREAWEKAQAIAPTYSIEITDETIETALDSYRDWLHARSRCPQCAMTGVQTIQATYHCLSCNHTWRVNDARRCGLKRYAVTT